MNIRASLLSGSYVDWHNTAIVTSQLLYDLDNTNCCSSRERKGEGTKCKCAADFSASEKSEVRVRVAGREKKEGKEAKAFREVSFATNSERMSPTCVTWYSVLVHWIAVVLLWWRVVRSLWHFVSSHHGKCEYPRNTHLYERQGLRVLSIACTPPYLSSMIPEMVKLEEP